MIHFRFKDTHRGGKKIFHTKENQKKEATLLSAKIDFKPKTVTGEEDSYIMIKGSIHQESYNMRKYIHASNIRTPKFINTNIYERRNQQYNKSSELQYNTVRNA